MFAEPAIEIDQNVDLRVADFGGRLRIVSGPISIQRSKACFSRALMALCIGAAIVDGDEFEARPVMAFVQSRHQDGGCLFAEFAGEIAQANFVSAICAQAGSCGAAGRRRMRSRA